jgi:hypothetical protein
MRRVTSLMLAVGVAAAGGMYALQSRPAVSGTFNGTISGGGSSSSSSGSALAFTSTQTDGGPGYCFNGSCAVSFSSDGGVVTLNGAELDATLANSQNVNADTIITPQAVVAQAASGQKAFGVAQNGARVYFCESGNCYCYDVGGLTTCANQWDLPAGVKTNLIAASTPGRDRVEIFYPQPYPLASLSTCDSTHMGVLKTLTTDERNYMCDGSTDTNLKIAGMGGPWSGSLDFAVFASVSCQTLTFAATGAVLNEPVAQGGCGSVLAGDTDLTCTVAISATNTASVRLCCLDAAGCADLASITFSAAAIR